MMVGHKAKVVRNLSSAAVSSQFAFCMYKLYVHSIDVYVKHLLWSARVAQSSQQ